MAAILQDPKKLVMLIFLLVLEIPAAIGLVVGWKRARREAAKEVPHE